MKRQLIFLVALIATVSQLLGQTITGKVVDTNNQPIAYANVALYVLPDSTLVTGTITNEAGDFSLETQSTEKGFLRVSFIGYETQDEAMVSGKVIVLKEDSHLLGEVVVKGNLPVVRIKMTPLLHPYKTQY